MICQSRDSEDRAMFFLLFEINLTTFSKHHNMHANAFITYLFRRSHCAQLYADPGGKNAMMYSPE
jgi:hypothetical protein